MDGTFEPDLGHNHLSPITPILVQAKGPLLTVGLNCGSLDGGELGLELLDALFQEAVLDFELCGGHVWAQGERVMVVLGRLDTGQLPGPGGWAGSRTVTRRVQPRAPPWVSPRRIAISRLHR